MGEAGFYYLPKFSLVYFIIFENFAGNIFYGYYGRIYLGYWREISFVHLGDHFRLPVCFDRNGEDAFFAVFGQNSCRDFALNHEHHARGRVGRGEEFVQERRGNVVGDVGDELVGCRW